MARKVFTYKDVEEAKKYIGKMGRFSDYLRHIETSDPFHATLKRVTDDGHFISEVDSCWEHFSPDPEPVEKWVPFTAEDWELFMGTTVTAISNKTFKAVIVGCNSEGVFLGHGDHVRYQALFNGFPRPDGTPCGKKILTESQE